MIIKKYIVVGSNITKSNLLDSLLGIVGICKQNGTEMKIKTKIVDENKFVSSIKNMIETCSRNIMKKIITSSKSSYQEANFNFNVNSGGTVDLIIDMEQSTIDLSNITLYDNIVDDQVKKFFRDMNRNIRNSIKTDLNEDLSNTNNVDVKNNLITSIIGNDKFIKTNIDKNNEINNKVEKIFDQLDKNLEFSEHISLIGKDIILGLNQKFNGAININSKGNVRLKIETKQLNKIIENSIYESNMIRKYFNYISHNDNMELDDSIERVLKDRLDVINDYKRTDEQVTEVFKSFSQILLYGSVFLIVFIIFLFFIKRVR